MKSLPPPDREPLEVELLVPDDRRRVTVQDHLSWRETLAAENRSAPFDAIDEWIDEQVQVDPYHGDPPSKRKDAEINRVLRILDELEGGKGQHD